MEQLEGWVTTKEAEDISGVSRTTLYIKRLLGEIQTLTVGRTVLYSRADCERIAEDRKAKGMGQG